MANMDQSQSLFKKMKILKEKDFIIRVWDPRRKEKKSLFRKSGNLKSDNFKDFNANKDIHHIRLYSVFKNPMRTVRFDVLEKEEILHQETIICDAKFWNGGHLEILGASDISKDLYKYPPRVFQLAFKEASEGSEPFRLRFFFEDPEFNLCNNVEVYLPREIFQKLSEDVQAKNIEFGRLNFNLDCENTKYIWKISNIFGPSKYGILKRNDAELSLEGFDELDAEDQERLFPHEMPVFRGTFDGLEWDSKIHDGQIDLWHEPDRYDSIY